MKNTLSSPRILVVDDEDDLRELYELTLIRQGYEVETAPSVAAALRKLALLEFDLVITDMRLDDGLGLAVIDALQREERRERCIVITAYGSAENAVQALKRGAFDYLTKPVDLKNLRQAVAAALDSKPTEPLVEASTQAARPTHEPNVSRLVGVSRAMQEVRDRIARVARSMAPVLILGESGTGKELVARELHALSHRASGSMVVVNCGAIPESLLEAEFFGAKKGAYTGAHQDRDGFFQAANGGTLFLDEIGDLPLALQPKLLRAIQERAIRSLGSSQEEPVDVRIISATHKDLNEEIKNGRFRQDLYYRLNVIDIVIPPLRERPEDLPDLCAHLLERITHASGAHRQSLDPNLLEQIQQLPLNGNVRELENLLHRLVVTGEVGILTALPAESPLPQPSSGPPKAASTDESDHAQRAAKDGLQNYLDHLERQILQRTLEKTGFNRTAAAAQLGISLRQIRYRIDRLQIMVPRGDDDEA